MSSSLPLPHYEDKIRSSKFKQGEKVLCFHGPLIYTARCLEVRVIDETRKFEYRIHYFGWKQKWDEWVAENRILKLTDTNIKKQKDLQKKYSKTEEKRKNKKKSSILESKCSKKSNSTKKVKRNTKPKGIAKRTARGSKSTNQFIETCVDETNEDWPQYPQSSEDIIYDSADTKDKINEFFIEVEPSPEGEDDTPFSEYEMKREFGGCNRVKFGIGESFTSAFETKVKEEIKEEAVDDDELTQKNENENDGLCRNDFCIVNVADLLAAKTEFSVTDSNVNIKLEVQAEVHANDHDNEQSTAFNEKDDEPKVESEPAKVTKRRCIQRMSVESSKLPLNENQAQRKMTDCNGGKIDGASLNSIEICSDELESKQVEHVEPSTSFAQLNDIYSIEVQAEECTSKTSKRKMVPKKVTKRRPSKRVSLDSGKIILNEEQEKPVNMQPKSNDCHDQKADKIGHTSQRVDRRRSSAITENSKSVPENAASESVRPRRNLSTETKKSASNAENPTKKIAKAEKPLRAKEKKNTTEEKKKFVPPPKIKKSRAPLYTLSQNLKNFLKDDWYCIFKEHKLLTLPAKPSVEELCGDFIKFYSSEIDVSDELAVCDGAYTIRMKARDERINSVIGIFAHLKKLFNLTLGSHLLYKFERTQFRMKLEKYPHQLLTEIYGAAHFLRLLHSLATKSSDWPELSKESLQFLQNIMNYFLTFLTNKAETYMSINNYYFAPTWYHREDSK